MSLNSAESRLPPEVIEFARQVAQEAKFPNTDLEELMRAADKLQRRDALSRILETRYRRSKVIFDLLDQRRKSLAKVW